MRSSETTPRTHLQEVLVGGEGRTGVSARSGGLRAGPDAKVKVPHVANEHQRVASRGVRGSGRRLSAERVVNRHVEHGVRGASLAALAPDKHGHAVVILDITQDSPEGRVRNDPHVVVAPEVANFD